jgi:acetyl-CoA carboxylase beta subunit
MALPRLLERLVSSLELCAGAHRQLLLGSAVAGGVRTAERIYRATMFAYTHELTVRALDGLRYVRYMRNPGFTGVMTWKLE